MRPIGRRCILPRVSDEEFRSALLRRVNGYRRRRQELQDRRSTIAEELESVGERLRKAEALFSLEFGEEVPEDVGAALLASNAKLFVLETDRPPGELTGMSWTDALVHVLRRHRDGLHVKALWAELDAGGFRTDARDPTRSIVAIALRRPDVFVRVGPNTYALNRAASRTTAGDADHNAALALEVD